MAAVANAPEIYLKQRKDALIISEIQLEPKIFRALKLMMDEMRLQHQPRQPEN